MNKTQFLTELKEKLYGLPDNDIQNSLDYYSEITTDTGDIEIKVGK